ncbi:MAG: hypothetical protein ACLU9X_12315 [Alistipes shahii]
MRFRTTTLLLVLLLTTARTTPARPVSKDTSRAAAFRAGCPKADGANLAVELRGGELRIRFAESEGRNLRYTFRRCMFNELFTFYEVAVEERNTETVLNRATSDNLGPLGIDGYGWAGANHSWREGGTVRTARHVGVSIEADGRCIRGDTSLRAREVTIRVENRIFDPRMPVADSAGRAELQTPLCTERVCYRVRENNIEVAVSHEFHNSVPATIRTYYGMQSMFCDETHTLTPTEPMPTGPAGRGFPLHQGRLPRIPTLRREKRPRLSIELAAARRYGRPRPARRFGRGIHRQLLRQELPPASGPAAGARGGPAALARRLHLVHLPIADDGELLCYEALAGEQRVLAIDCKRRCDRTVTLPGRSLRRLRTIDRHGDISIRRTGAHTLRIRCEGPASCILRTEVLHRIESENR